MAFTTGQGTVNGNKIIVGKTADNFVSSAYKTIDYGETIPDPVFISQMQTCNDDSVTAVLRCTSVTENSSNIVKQRERSTGNFVQAAETAGWLVTTAVPNFSSGINDREVPELRIYPNPVKDIIVITGISDSESSEAEILNLSGMKVKSLKIEQKEMDVSDLPKGYYILQIRNRIPAKFVKQ